MNKKFLSAVLFGAFMVGSTVTFTGCIDNDEPAGIENLRGAKAELLRAKVAVEEANAARKNAEATLILAQAETEKAQAEMVKLQAEAVRLQNELLAAQNEEEKSRIEMQIAQYKQQMEENALKHQKKMFTLQENLATAKRKFEIAMKQIEIAQAILSESEKVTLGELTMEVNGAQAEVDEKAGAVEEAEKSYYNAVLDSRADSVNFKRLELKLVRAQADQAIAEETLAKWSDFLKEDTETADWRKEITTLEDSIDGLNKKKVELDVEYKKLEEADAYKNLQAAKEQTAEAYANLKTTAKLEYKDMLKETKTVEKNTPVREAVVTIGGLKADGKGGYIKEMNDKIAGYTSQKQALLDELAAATEADLAAKKEASDKAIKAWKDATAAYATAKGYTAEAKDLKAVKDAAATYEASMTAAQGDAKKQLKAQQVFADAIVKYYNAAAPVQLTTNKISLELTLNGKKTLVAKTVKDWLSDSDNKDVYLEGLITYFGSVDAFWTVSTTSEKVENDVVTVRANGALATLKSVSEILKDLQNASNAAFGKASLYGDPDENGYMRVQPTEAEVKAILDYNSVCGALGAYYYFADPETQFEAKNYKEIIADYEKAVTYWTEQLTALNKANADAKAAKEKAEKAVEDYKEQNLDAIITEQGIIAKRITALTNIKTALISAVDTWLKENGDYQSTEKFEAWLKSKVQGAEDDVIAKEEKVVEAENALTQAKDGKYDNLSTAKADLDKAMAELEKAQAKLAEATANLQKGVEIMTKASAE